jgi:hypothetical protein
MSTAPNPTEQVPNTAPEHPPIVPRELTFINTAEEHTIIVSCEGTQQSQTPLAALYLNMERFSGRDPMTFNPREVGEYDKAFYYILRLERALHGVEQSTGPLPYRFGEKVQIRGGIPLGIAVIGAEELSEHARGKIRGNMFNRKTLNQNHPILSEGLNTEILYAYARFDLPIRRLFRPAYFDVDVIVDATREELKTALSQQFDGLWRGYVLREAGNGAPIAHIGRDVYDDPIVSGNVFVEATLKSDNPLGHKSNLEKPIMVMEDGNFIIRNIPKISQNGRFILELPEYPDDMDKIYKFWSLSKSLGYGSLYYAELDTQKLPEVESLQETFQSIADLEPNESSNSKLARFERALIELFWAYEIDRDLLNRNLVELEMIDEHNTQLTKRDFNNYLRTVVDKDIVNTAVDKLIQYYENDPSQFVAYLLNDKVRFLINSIRQKIHGRRAL